MASEKQIAANRRNAQSSTGPQTPEGKARSARNATRHGLLAREAVLPEEDIEAYRGLVAELEEHFRPADPLEKFLVRDIASAQWRLLRLTRIETGYFIVRMEELRRLEYDEDPAEADDPHDEETRLFGLLLRQSVGDAFATLLRQENSLRRAWYKAVAALEKHRVPNEPNPPARDPDSRRAAPPVPADPAPESAPARQETSTLPAARALFAVPSPASRLVATVRPPCTRPPAEPCAEEWRSGTRTAPADRRPSACCNKATALLAAA